MRQALLLAFLALFCAACAGIIEPRLPEEFKGKKVKEDPPLTLHQPCTEPHA